MSSRRHRERSSSKKDDSQSFHIIHDWNRRPHNVEPGNPNPVQDKDKHHRSTRRAPDVLGELPASSASYPYHKSSASRDQSHYTQAAGPGYYNTGDYAAAPNPLSQVQPATMPVNGTAHPRDSEPYDYRSYMKAQKKSSKRSPPSSDEKTLAAEQARMAQSSQDTRQTAVPGSSAPQPPASTQSFWIPPTQPTRDPGTSTRHKDRDDERDRKRDKERRKEKDRDKERERERRKAQEEEQARELERQRDKERRREERRREKERAEQQKYDEERERRRQERRERKAKEEEARKRQETRPVEPPSATHASAANIIRHKTPRPDDRTSTRQPYSEQIPSSSSNIALPSTQYTPVPHATTTRPQASGDARRVVDYSTEREKRKHRTHRDRTQPNESGMSSSEQEHSGRERGARTAERRRDHFGDNPSGPSGSENERTGRQRVPRRQPPTDGYVDAPAHAPNMGQTALPVGHATFANHVPHVVSIRAGQGPADPQTPILPAKSHTVPAPTSRQLDSQGNDAGYTPVGLVRSSSIPHNAFLHPNAALSMTHQANLASSGHQHHGHGSGAAQRNETQGTALSNIHAPSALPSGTLEAPARPPSTRPPGHSVGPNNVQGYSYTKQQVKPSPPQASQILNSKADVSHLYPNPATDNQSTHVAKLSVYHSPDPPVSADLYVPNSKYTMPSHGQYQPAQNGTFSPQQGPEPAPGEDTPRAAPIPIPEPRRMYSSTPAPPSAPAPAPDQSPAQPYDPRSPKQNVPAPGQILSASPWQTSRSQISPGQMRSATLPNTQTHDSPSAAVHNVHPQASSRGAQLASQSTAVNGSTSSQSPRNAQVSSLRAAQGTGTPKHSPSGRLNPRNGSNDTISLPYVAKQSPSGTSTRPLNQTNIASAQSHAHAQSRPDTTTRGVTSMTSGYPDNARYRSQAPSSSYPLANSSSQPQSSTNVLSSNVNQTQANISSSVPHQSHSYARNPVQTTNPTSHLPTTDYPVRNHEPTITGYAPAQDYAQRSQPTPTPANTNGSSAAAIAAAYRSGTYHQEFGRPTEPASAPPTQTTHRIPPRSAPSPAPSARYYPNPQTTNTSRSAYPPAIAAPTPIRGQTYAVPETGRGRSTSTPAPSHLHSRTVSDSQAGNFTSRVAVAGHPSTPAPGKHHPPAIDTSLSPAPEQDPLRTPSSLAPSMLHRGNSFSSIRNAAPSITPSKEKESRKRGGFLGLFRSRSSPPKQAEVRPPVMPKETKNRSRANSQTTINGIAASVKNIVAPHPNHTPTMTHNRPSTVRPEHQVPQSAPPTQTTYQHIHQPHPIAAPTPIAAEQRMSSAKMFTPFRLLSKRHRTVSAASVEAQDGTAANTVVDSTRSSTAGRPSPPLRDPTVATIDWRDRGEAEQSVRKGSRRYRPGVTFDVDPDSVDQSLLRPSRQRNGA
ncbi:hypothetical protein QCA50_002933 [Cerrena zonata]|uniref:Uncharacterized protein n=1 Tax=Cerrena zonata TaxID=2478898 RepID=A0AAW0GQQ2_9APHY